MSNFDEMIDSYEDDDFDAPLPAMDGDEYNRRLEAHEAEVQRNRKIIMSPRQYDKKQRMEAVRWLGETGAATAVPDLLTVYRKDKTPGMKEVVTYALGQLKALHNSLDDAEVYTETIERLERVQLYGELGTRVNRSGIILRQLGLLISLLILGALALFAPQLRRTAAQSGIIAPTGTPVPPTATLSPTPDTPEIALDALVDYYTALLADADALAGQLSNVTRGESQDCAELANNFNNPSDFVLSPNRTEANLVQISEQLNDASSLIDPVREAFNASCEAGEPIPREQALNEHFDSIVNAQRQLRDAAGLFDANSVQLPPTATSTPLPTPTPTATPDFAILRPHVQTLEVIISDMIGLGSPTGRLVTYWDTVQEFGGSPNLEGCLQTRFEIPDDYVLPENIAAEFPRLAQATEHVNLGLLVARQTNEQFFSSCERNQFPPDVQTWIDRTNTSIDAFEQAQALLNEIQGRS